MIIEYICNISILADDFIKALNIDNFKHHQNLLSITSIIESKKKSLLDLRRDLKNQIQKMIWKIQKEIQKVENLCSKIKNAKFFFKKTRCKNI